MLSGNSNCFAVFLKQYRFVQLVEIVFHIIQRDWIIIALLQPIILILYQTKPGVSASRSKRTTNENFNIESIHYFTIIHRMVKTCIKRNTNSLVAFASYTYIMVSFYFMIIIRPTHCKFCGAIRTNTQQFTLLLLPEHLVHIAPAFEQVLFVFHILLSKNCNGLSGLIDVDRLLSCCSHQAIHGAS